MTLILPTNNSSITFSLGSNTVAADPIMGKSLDDLIKDRRKEQVQTSRRGPKKVENADRAIATGRAKRQAAINARRGLSQSKKPTAMEVDKEVYRESRKTAVAKERKQKKVAQGRIPADATARRQRKKVDAKKDPKQQQKKQGKKQPAKQQPAKQQAKQLPANLQSTVNGRPPSKKVVNAAVNAMQDKGFAVPDGMKVVISFAPVEKAKTPAKKTAAKTTTPNKKGAKGNQKQTPPKNNNKGSKSNGGGRRKN